MGIIKAIETRYGGYHFRSRLEARWAVFMDELGIKWVYEPQGYTLDTPIGRVNYLPDFWLKFGMWAEVKGYLDEDATRRLCAIGTALAVCGSGHDVVVLGNLPKPGSALWPVQLHWHDRLYALPWSPAETGCPLGRPALDADPTAEMASILTGGFLFGVPEWAEPGLEAARSARFEWGQSGAT